MRLQPPQLEILRRYLETHFKNPCHVCGTGNWQFDDVLFELRQLMAPSPNQPQQTIVKPLVAVTCNTCGNVTMLNAMQTGVIQVVPPNAQAQQALPQEMQPEAIDDMDEEEEDVVEGRRGLGPLEPLKP